MTAKTRTQILEALAQYQRQGFIERDTHTLIDLLADESDRGVVVILGSHIEDALLDRVLRELREMTETEQKQLTKAGGPLRDANSRIVMARAMDILTEAEADVLHAFRAMRNACSHSRKDISFQTPELVAAFSLITPWFTSDDLMEKTPELRRSVFILTAVFMLSLLESSREQAVEMLKESLKEVGAGESEPSPERRIQLQSEGLPKPPKG